MANTWIKPIEIAVIFRITEVQSKRLMEFLALHLFAILLLYYIYLELLTCLGCFHANQSILCD